MVNFGYPYNDIVICKDSTDYLLQLYKSVVRPHVEFAISSWSPHFKKDIEAIEKIQHRFTRLLPRMKHLSYEDRLIKLNLTTLERRRERGDIIQTYKIMHGSMVFQM